MKPIAGAEVSINGTLKAGPTSTAGSCSLISRRDLRDCGEAPDMETGMSLPYLGEGEDIVAELDYDRRV